MTPQSSQAVVQHVAALARLQITAEEEQLYAQQLAPILDLMAELNQLPTDDVPPMTHAVEMLLREREDRLDEQDWHDRLMACAPEVEEGHFRVPKVIE
ncbi:MAG: Asp-tRNA(Asn)/Glu-tRNA(Gln) amidotransferase subunit GatC [Magnetococcales bacterium]|nr:Asp-tRNA(Asn)/Glu-tRNA(Gln) amidotransferase subunit GatC [Magnetococcales bacterium]